MQLWRVMCYTKDSGSLRKVLDYMVLAESEDAALAISRNTMAYKRLFVSDTICRALGGVEKARVVVRLDDV